jgi:hypothetical protein
MPRAPSPTAHAQNSKAHPMPLRAAWLGETALSPAEVLFGLERGLIARRHVQTVRCWS